MKKLSQKDVVYLYAIFDFRILSIEQMTKLCFTSQQMARRKIREFVKAGLIKITTRGFGISAGRPERLISLSNTAVKILKEMVL